MAPHEIIERELLFKKFFQLPAEAQYPACSFEFLGMVPVDLHRPFTFHDKLNQPSIGKSTLLVDNSEQWTCYYRGVYENPLHDLTQYKHQHWPVLFYCPASNSRTSCANLLNAATSPSTDINSGKTENATLFVDLALTLPLLDSSASWEVKLHVDILKVMKKDPPTSHPKAALCTAIPYTSSEEERLEANGALLYEFIRYHSHLGLKVIIFDRGGRSFEHVTSKYIYNRRGEDIENYDFDYFNYTILEKLKQYRQEIRAESLEGLSRDIVRTDFDKRFSITYCRYVAKALYGIERVLVLDFDEYVYCASAKPTADDQAVYLAKHMDKLKAQGIEQYVMRQRVQVSRTPDMRQCLLSQIELSKRVYHELEHGNLTVDRREILEVAWKNASVFQCIAAYRYLVRRNFDKSFHLGHYCPYTSFHHSSNLRHFDCVTTVRRDFDEGCHAIHYTTKPPNYNRTHPHDMVRVVATPSELYLVTSTFEDSQPLSEVLSSAVLTSQEQAQAKRIKKQQLLKRLRSKNRVKVRQQSLEDLQLLGG
ncbi:hypothetical protein EON64_05525 [archaeon]|nr:MAG: hypothetical protein EON64_05525 [archaeon]